MAYIDKETTIKELEKMPAYFESGDIRYGIIIAIDILEKQAPTSDVAEVRHGKWIMRGGRFRCSECDGKALIQDVGGTGGFSHEFEQVKSDICPHCGAKMDGKDGE